MTHINCYITFNGNCREAMTFYQHCLGGELELQTIGESPMADKMPAKMKESILHATLTNKNIIMMGSDIVTQQGLTTGNGVSLMLNCSSQAELKTFFEKLSANGLIEHSLENTFWGGTIGNLTDQFGKPWILHYTSNT